MDQKTFPVQPLGKLGRTYLLNKKQYCLHKSVNIAMLSLIGILVLFSTVISKFKALPWPDDHFVLLSIVLAILNFLILFAIASQGRIANGDEESKAQEVSAKSSQISKLLVSGIKWYAFVVALLFFILFVAGAWNLLFIKHEAIPNELWVFVVPIIFIPVFYDFKKLSFSAIAIIFSCILGGGLSVLIILGIIFGVIFHVPIPIEEIMLLAVSLFVFVYNYRKWRKNE